MVINNARSDPRLYRELDRVLGFDVHSMIAVPMIFRGESIGVIEAVNKRSSPNYTDEDISILEAITAQASIAILSTLMLEEMKDAYETLEESEKKKSDFIAIASHELRTPVGLILGHSTYLYETVKDPQVHAELEVIVRSADRLKKIVEDFSNINDTPPESEQRNSHRVGVVRLAREVVSGFQTTSRNKYILLTAELPRYELLVEGDEERLKIALSNLVENALIFTDRNGHVLVSVEKLPGYVKISVIDDGIGIPARDLTHVFERFYQVEGHLTRRHGGMGLGLSVAKTMVEMHDGQIWVESVEGKGSNFSILLPLADTETISTVSDRKNIKPVKPFE